MHSRKPTTQVANASQTLAERCGTSFSLAVRLATIAAPSILQHLRTVVIVGFGFASGLLFGIVLPLLIEVAKSLCWGSGCAKVAWVVSRLPDMYLSGIIAGILTMIFLKARYLKRWRRGWIIACGAFPAFALSNAIPQHFMPMYAIRHGTDEADRYIIMATIFVGTTTLYRSFCLDQPAVARKSLRGYAVSTLSFLLRAKRQSIIIFAIFGMVAASTSDPLFASAISAGLLLTVKQLPRINRIVRRRAVLSLKNGTGSAWQARVLKRTGADKSPHNR